MHIINFPTAFGNWEFSNYAIHLKNKPGNYIMQFEKCGKRQNLKLQKIFINQTDTSSLRNAFSSPKGNLWNFPLSDK